jgi:hypothetical protein
MNYDQCCEVLVSALDKCQCIGAGLYIIPTEHVPLHVYKFYRDKYGSGMFIYHTETEAHSDEQDEYGYDFYPCETIMYANYVDGQGKPTLHLRDYDGINGIVLDGHVDDINTHIYNIYTQTAGAR